MSNRPPWEIVETLPSTDAALIEGWQRRVDAASTAAEQVEALVGRALSLYWAGSEGLVDDTGAELADRRRGDVDAATAVARRDGAPDLVATALLGQLYACWGPDGRSERAAVLAELEALGDAVTDPELRLRRLEWTVLEAFDAGDLDAVRRRIERFAAEAAVADLPLFGRRRELWEANVAMLEGRIDESLRTNQQAISSTAEVAGSPFSFQNVAITLAIERFLRCGLDEVIDAIRSIRASSPRVAVNWEVGLAFALAECGELDEARELFDEVAADSFSGVPRDLNWLVTMQLLALVALHLDDAERMAQLCEQLGPFEMLDATHGSGYASYGPVARVLGSMAARLGRLDEAAGHFEVAVAGRAPGPWTSLARLDRARAFAAADPRAAQRDARSAAVELAAMGMDAWAERAGALADRLQLDGHGAPLARRDGDRWHLVHPSGSAVVAASVGVDQLVELLARPGSPVDAVDLDGSVDPAMPREASTVELVDAEARRAYRQRLAELEADGGAASADGAAEVDALRAALAGAAHRPSGSAELERARVRVTKAVRRALAAVAEASPSLGAHLEGSVSTGRRLLYDPGDATPWDVRRRG